MSYQVAVLNFEGPLDLLLQLVEKSQVEVTAISLAELTKQYLEYLDQLQALSASDLHSFIDLASRLVYIKSLALLPDSAIEIDPGVMQLREQLATYQRYHHAAKYLSSLLSGGRSFKRTQVKQKMSSDTPLPAMDVIEISRAFTAAMAKIPKKSVVLTQMPLVSLEEMMANLCAFAAEGQARLEDFISRLPGRMECITAFIATLELLKLGRLSVYQDLQFGAIMVRDEKHNA